MEYIENIQAKYPLACSILEISRNWDIFCSKWVNDDDDVGFCL